MSEIVNSNKLRFLDVIQCARFAQGNRDSIHSSLPIEVGMEPPLSLEQMDPALADFLRDQPAPENNATDPSRGEALFVVLTVTPAGLTGAFGGPGTVWTEVVARRLQPDGTWNGSGELVKFRADGISGEAVHTVTRVGTMKLTMEPAQK